AARHDHDPLPRRRLRRRPLRAELEGEALLPARGGRLRRGAPGLEPRRRPAARPRRPRRVPLRRP
ncbi:MAG: hypothetical protein AVDCRST_MAG30-2010, partial [uncultured Solirubrobacteraceae bacterium]